MIIVCVNIVCLFGGWFDLAKDPLLVVGGRPSALARGPPVFTGIAMTSVRACFSDRPLWRQALMTNGKLGSPTLPVVRVVDCCMLITHGSKRALEGLVGHYRLW
jgi:hypothetical protein